MHRVMVSYLKASKEQRLLMAAAMPDILTSEVCEELASADALIRDSGEAAKDALSYGNTLLREVAPTSSALVPHATLSEEAAGARGIVLGVDSEGLVQSGGADFEESDLLGDGLGTFEEILAGLMAKQEEASTYHLSLSGRGEPRPADGDGDTANNRASSSGSAGGAGGIILRAEQQRKERASCVLLPTAVLTEVFSFLPIMDVIEVCEHVCQYWNHVTNSASTAQAFWIGCVHREYPSQLAALIASEGPSLFEANWRTIATIIVCNELSIEDGDEEEES